jgi:CMP/dCMP kinase
VRKNLLHLQRNFGEGSRGVILDGRDIGTVIFPDADFKFYITAAASVRANRRFLQENGKSYDATLADIVARDQRDKNRENAPLMIAADAIVIDTSELNVEKSLQKILANLSSIL